MLLGLRLVMEGPYGLACAVLSSSLEITQEDRDQQHWEVDKVVVLESG